MSVLAGMTVVTAAVAPARPVAHSPSGMATVFADQPGPADPQLLRESRSARQEAFQKQAGVAPPTPPSIHDIIASAFSPLGGQAVGWALRIAYCESTYNPTAVNSDTGAQGLFQFLPSTWRGTPYANQSPFDPVANANAAAWLLQAYGPSQWECQA